MGASQAIQSNYQDNNTLISFDDKNAAMFVTSKKPINQILHR